MLHVKTLKQFKESLIINIQDFDINESLNIWFDSLLNSIGADKINMYDVFKLKKDINIDLEYLNNNTDFISSLSTLGLKNSKVENTEDYETFCSGCRFMFIYDQKQNELETPLYLLLQIYDTITNKWLTTDCYKINGDIKKFYDKLSSKTIEIIDGDEKYIYKTSNKNEWTLMSLKSTDVYKKYFRKEDLEKIIKDRKVKIHII